MGRFQQVFVNAGKGKRGLRDPRLGKFHREIRRSKPILGPPVINVTAPPNKWGKKPSLASVCRVLAWKKTGDIFGNGRWLQTMRTNGVNMPRRDKRENRGWPGDGLNAKIFAVKPDHRTNHK